MLFLLGCFQLCYAQSYPDSVIFKSFKQDSTAGNCASISVIKSAIQTFGIDNVLKSCKQNDSGYLITLRNDSTLFLSLVDEKIVNNLDRIKCDSKDSTFYKKAKFYYAVMAKNNMLLHYNTSSTIIDATMHDSIVYLQRDTEKNIQLLGLDNNFKNILTKIDSINYIPNIIITNFKHSVYSSLGQFDQYGVNMDNCEFIKKHSAFFTRLFGRRKINGVYQLFR